MARDKLARLRQRTSVQDYTQRFYSITLDIPNITEEECIDRYIRGLKPRVAREVELRGLNVLDEIVVAAQRFDSIDFRLSDSGKSPTRYFKGYSDKRFQNHDKSDPSPMEIDAIDQNSKFDAKKSRRFSPPKKLTEEDKATMRKEGRCYYCRKVGHVALSCPNKSFPKNEKKG